MKPEIVNMLTWEDVEEIVVADCHCTAHMRINDYLTPREYYSKVLDRLRENNMSESQRRYLYLIGKAQRATGCKATKKRDRGSVLTRSFVSYRLWEEGMTYADIGRISGRNHATVINQVRNVKDMLDLPSAFKKETEMYHEFERLLEDGE